MRLRVLHCPSTQSQRPSPERGHLCFWSCVDGSLPPLLLAKRNPSPLSWPSYWSPYSYTHWSQPLSFCRWKFCIYLKFFVTFKCKVTWWLCSVILCSFLSCVQGYYIRVYLITLFSSHAEKTKLLTRGDLLFGDLKPTALTQTASTGWK